MKTTKKSTASNADSSLPEAQDPWGESTDPSLPLTLEDIERELKWLLKHGLIEIVPGSDILDPCYRVKGVTEAGMTAPRRSRAM